MRRGQDNKSARRATDEEQRELWSLLEESEGEDTDEPTAGRWSLVSAGGEREPELCLAAAVGDAISRGGRLVLANKDDELWSFVEHPAKGPVWRWANKDEAKEANDSIAAWEPDGSDDDETPEGWFLVTMLEEPAEEAAICGISVARNTTGTLVLSLQQDELWAKAI